MSWLAKEAAGEIPNNENDSTVNYSDLYDSPEDRKDTSNVDGRWGEGGKTEQGRQAPFHQNDATYAASQKERHEVAGRAYSTLPAASANARAVLSANLEHARSGDFTAHSLGLQSATKEGSASLSERVRDIIDRF